MSKSNIKVALPTFGEISKASNYSDHIIPKKFDFFSLSERAANVPTTKVELALFHNQEKEEFRRKYLNSYETASLAKLEAMLNSMYALAKRHCNDERTL